MENKFRSMRRTKQYVPETECIEILKKADTDVLALIGDGDYPYAVPLNFVYDSGKIYFHSAMAGHKVDAAAKNEKASFCVIDKDKVVPEEYATHYRSIIIFGKIKIMEDEPAKRDAIEKLAIKYAPKDSAENRNYEIDDSMDHLCMLELSIEHMTGKEAMALAQERETAVK